MFRNQQDENVVEEVDHDVDGSRNVVVAAAISRQAVVAQPAPEAFHELIRHVAERNASKSYAEYRLASYNTMDWIGRSKFFEREGGSDIPGKTVNGNMQAVNRTWNQPTHAPKYHTSISYTGGIISTVLKVERRQTDLSRHIDVDKSTMP